MEPYKIIRNPLSTEKGIRLMEAENKLVFAVDRNSTKKQLKESIEMLFKSKVESVNTMIVKGKKRAYVKFRKETPAIEIATQLGLM